MQPDNMIAMPRAAAVLIRCLMGNIGELLIGSTRITYAMNNETRPVRCNTNCNRMDFDADPSRARHTDPWHAKVTKNRDSALQTGAN